jgi:hypothetical protein
MDRVMVIAFYIPLGQYGERREVGKVFRVRV